MTASRRTAGIVGVYNTRQGRRLDGDTSRSLAVEAVRGALDDAGIALESVDGITSGGQATTLIYDLRLGPAWQGFGFGLGMITEAVGVEEVGRVAELADVVQIGSRNMHAMPLLKAVAQLFKALAVNSLEQEEFPAGAADVERHQGAKG